VAAPRDLINQKDPESYAPSLLNRHAVGGNNQPKLVDVAPRARKVKGNVRVGSTGTLRDGPKKFAIGNVAGPIGGRPGWIFEITRTTCRRADGKPYGPEQWVFGYSPDAHRWGWVQARHLPDCTRP
jgi:hypothetical protein